MTFSALGTQRIPLSLVEASLIGSWSSSDRPHSIANMKIWQYVGMWCTAVWQYDIMAVWQYVVYVSMEV